MSHYGQQGTVEHRCNSGHRMMSSLTKPCISAAAATVRVVKNAAKA
jgi:hypothetical protein